MWSSWQVGAEDLKTRKNWEEYMLEMARFKFVISPEVRCLTTATLCSSCKSALSGVALALELSVGPCRCDATGLRADDGIGGARRSATSWRAPVCVHSACFIEQAWACVCACERGCLGHLTVCANALCAEIYRIIMRGRGTHARTAVTHDCCLSQSTASCRRCSACLSLYDPLLPAIG